MACWVFSCAKKEPSVLRLFLFISLVQLVIKRLLTIFIAFELYMIYRTCVINAIDYVCVKLLFWFSITNCVCFIAQFRMKRLSWIPQWRVANRFHFFCFLDRMLFQQVTYVCVCVHVRSNRMTKKMSIPRLIKLD